MESTIEITPIAWCIKDGKKRIVLSNGFTMGMESDDAMDKLIKNLQEEAKRNGCVFEEMDYDDYYGWGFLKELRKHSKDEDDLK